jgi:hypothetical protein
MDEFKAAVDSCNFNKAEELVTVLGECDPSAKMLAISYMMNNIYKQGQSPSDEAKEMTKRAEASVKELPVSFMTHKIFFPEGA